MIAVDAIPVDDRVGRGRVIEEVPTVAATPAESRVGRGSVIAEVPVTPSAVGMIYAIVRGDVSIENGSLLKSLISDSDSW